MSNKPTEGKPPVFGKWKTIYLVVLTNLVLMILAMYVFSKYFA